MNADEYQKSAMVFLNRDTRGDNQRDNAVLGLVGESGEIADKLKKHLFHGAPDKHTFGRDEVLDEAGDVLWYVALLCSWAGLTMSDVMQYNIEKLSKRYPDKFDAKRSWERYTTADTAE